MTGRGLRVAGAVIILDQLSKYVVLHQIFDKPACTNDSQVVAVFLTLVSTCNRGMSFGLFNAGQGLNVPLFSLAAIAIVAVLVWWLSRVHSELLATAIGLIIGGAIGNVIDRVRFGFVVDFIDAHLGDWHWYVFNVADAAIVCGVATLVLENLLPGRRGQA